MDLEQFDEAFDTEVGEGDDAFVVETVDPDEAVFGLHSQSDVIERVDVFAKFLCDKIDGLDVLVRLLGDRELDFVALMSSISSVIGSPGTCGYAAANAVFDSFVESTARPLAWKQVVAVNWAAWRETGMAADLIVPEHMRAARDAFLRTAIATEAGVDAFARILASRRRRVIMTSDDVEAPFALRGTPAVSVTRGDRTSQAHSCAPGPSSAVDRGEVRNPPVTDTEKCLATIWTELIGDTGLGVDDDFFDLGGHSLLATRVIARVSAALGVRLALRGHFATTAAKDALLYVRQHDTGTYRRLATEPSALR